MTVVTEFLGYSFYLTTSYKPWSSLGLKGPENFSFFFLSFVILFTAAHNLIDP